MVQRNKIYQPLVTQTMLVVLILAGFRIWIE